MAYLTIEEFRELSTLDIPNDILPKLITRAERAVDTLTKFKALDYYNLNNRNAQIIKTAVMYQVEFYDFNGEFVGIENTDSVKIGNYSESKTNGGKATMRYAPALIEILLPTGLLYAGVGSMGDRWLR